MVGDGTQGRDFVHVSDVAKAFLKAAQTNKSNQIWNLGAGCPQSVNTLVKLIGGTAVYIPRRPGEPDCTWADISKIKKDLNWSPEVSFEEGVAQMISDIDRWHNAPLWTPDSIAEATRTWFQYLGKD